MPREKFKTLTEQMFYVLLCLREECRGVDVLERVSALTEGRVTVGSGTLYDLLDLFVAEGMIAETATVGRRRSYRITDRGREMLAREYARLQAQIADFTRVMGEED